MTTSNSTSNTPMTAEFLLGQIQQATELAATTPGVSLTISEDLNLSDLPSVAATPEPAAGTVSVKVQGSYYDVEVRDGDTYLDVASRLSADYGVSTTDFEWTLDGSEVSDSDVLKPGQQLIANPATRSLG